MLQAEATASAQVIIAATSCSLAVRDRALQLGILQSVVTSAWLGGPDRIRSA